MENKIKYDTAFIECFDIDWPWQFEIAEKLYVYEK